MRYWYSHRLSDNNPDVRAKNLSDARRRFEEQSEVYQLRGIRLWAPWIVLAELEVPEDIVWGFIEASLPFCAGIVLDPDGHVDCSPGMIRERDIMLSVGGAVEVVR